MGKRALGMGRGERVTGSRGAGVKGGLLKGVGGGKEVGVNLLIGSYDHHQWWQGTAGTARHRKLGSRARTRRRPARLRRGHPA